MALTDENGNMSTTMLVSPTGGSMGGYGSGDCFGGNGFWILLLFLLIGGNGWGGFGGYGGGNDLYPWMNQSNQINGGFRDQMISAQLQGIQNSVTSGFGDTALGIAGINQNICQTGNSIVGAVNGAQNAITAQMYANQIADMQQSFAAQTATMQGFNGVQSGLADVRYTEATEACATRNASAQNTRDIIDSQTRGTQAILDKLCQLELDGVKAQVEAKNDRISELQTQLNMANLQASQTAQNAFISQGFANEVDALYNRLSNCPVPSTPVYGRTPIFTCNQQANPCGCGCGNGSF